MLLGTILPICVGIICILLGILAFVWYRKRTRRGANSRLDMSSKLMEQSTNPNNPETEQMLLKQDNDFARQTVLVMSNQDKIRTNGNGPKG